MSIACDVCGRNNRSGAMFCIGCAGKLPGFSPTGPSMLESTRRKPRTAPVRFDSTARLVADPGARNFFKTWLWLGTGGLVVGIAFTTWFWTRHVDGSPLRRPSTAGLVAQAPANSFQTDQASGGEARPPSAPAERFSHGGPVNALPAPPQDSPNAAPLATHEPKTAPPNVSSPPTSGLASDASARTVEKFYHALSRGDGQAAAAFITPLKRGRGPFNENAMSKFYGPLRAPLILREVRPLGAGVVEARYRYRAAQSTCNGIALIHTEERSGQTLIRGIRANC